MKSINGIEGQIKHLFNTFADTSVERATASVPSDLASILKLVTNEFGYSEFDSKINDLLRRWIIELVKQQVN